MNRVLVRAAGVAAVFFAGIVDTHATNGYLVHGYGIKAQGNAGVGVASPRDTLAIAANPAGIAEVGDRLDAGLSWFRPDRGAGITGNGFGADGDYSGNGKNDFFIPEFGYTHVLSDAWTAGVAVYGQGGMNTDYRTNPYAAFGGTGSAGVDLSQLFVTPAAAYRLNDDHALGIAVNLAYQRFKAEGLGAFAGASEAPDNLTDRGYDSSTGAGVKLGWTGNFGPAFTAGISWSSKIDAGEFDKYKGLFADAGSFDIPETYAAGLNYRLAPTLQLGAEVQRILYGDVPSIANPLSNLFAGHPLGSGDGPGFGWKDTTVWKLGIDYDYSDTLTLRGGYSHATQPIPDDQTFFNILAPGVIRDHLSIGATWKAFADGEISLAYTHALKEEVEGSGSIPAAFGGGEADIHLSEDILGIAFGWKLQ